MSESNSIFKTGWMAFVLVGAVLVLFCAWLFLKVYRSEPRTSQKNKQVQNEETIREEKGTDTTGTETNTKTGKPDQQKPEDDQPETSEEESESDRDTSTESPASSEKSTTQSEEKDKNDQSNDELKKQETKSSDQTVSEKDMDEEDADDDTDQNTEKKEETNSDTTEDASTEQETVQVDQKKLEKAKDLYAKKAFQKAIGQLDEILNDLDNGKRAEELRTLKSTWTSEYKQRQKLADQWISKAEKASEKSDWSGVIERAKNALDHIPGHTRAEELIKRANKMKVYQGMVKIPAGTYSYLEDQSTEGKRISAFYIDRYEVTNSEYKTFMEETGHDAPIGWDDRTIPVGRKDHPVSGISYKDAKAYASWAGKQLPSERQWEVAARGSSGRTYPWGNMKSDGGSHFANTVEMGVGGSVSVDELSKSCTPKKVCHLVGNVAEWTRTTNTSETGKTLQVVKGGSYLYPVDTGKPSKRLLRDPDVRLKAIGFRCVKGPK